MSALAKQAAFPLNPHRRAMIAKLHIARAQLGMVEDDYVQLLIDHAGVTSSADADDRGLEAALKRMTQLGFRPLPSKPARGNAPTARLADSPSARKARALWISLYQLGAVHSQAESALVAFGKRQLKVEQLQWADQALMYRLIEALKAIGRRHGWDQSLDDVPAKSRLYTLKQRLAVAILAKLKAANVVAAHWDLEKAVEQLSGERLVRSVEGFELACVVLGSKLREVGQ